MIATSLRSSFLTTLDSCEQKAFLQYNLHLPSPANLAATKGSIVHKVLECLALGKQAIQNGKEDYDAEELGMLHIKSIDDIEFLLDLSITLYAKENPEIKLTRADEKECLLWVNNTLNWQNGLYDPRNRHIVAPEQHFDLEIKETWAKFDYKLDDRNISGYLGVKGTIDLVTMEDNQLSIVDWKTGKRINWSNFKVKEHDDLEQDIQFLLYYYACSILYPEYDAVLFTVFFVKDGGPYTFMYSRDKLPKIEARLKKYFDEIRKIQVPRLAIGKQCRFCPYSKISVTLEDSPCAFFNDQILKKGLYKVISEFGKDKTFSTYAGGGRKIEKEKE